MGLFLESEKRGYARLTLRGVTRLSLFFLAMAAYVALVGPWDGTSVFCTLTSFPIFSFPTEIPTYVPVPGTCSRICGSHTGSKYGQYLYTAVRICRFTTYCSTRGGYQYLLCCHHQTPFSQREAENNNGINDLKPWRLSCVASGNDSVASPRTEDSGVENPLSGRITE
jgi:hypothetical protein